MVIEKENAIADWRALIGPTDAKKAKVTHPDRLVALLVYHSALYCPMRNYVLFLVSIFYFLHYISF